MWSKVERHEFPRYGNIIEALDSQPKRFGARLSIACAAEKAAEASYHADGFSERRWLIRRFWILSDKTIQGFPLGLFKENRARHIGSLASELGQMKDTPSHYHVDGQTGFDAIGAAQLALFDLTTAFQRAVIDFNAPAFGIPPKLLHSLIKVLDVQRREQHPLNRLCPLGHIDLLSQNRRDGDLSKFGLALGRLEPDFFKAHLKARLSGCALGLAWHTYDLDTRQRLCFDLFPQPSLLLCQLTIMLGPHQQVRSPGSVQCQMKQLIDIGFPVSDTDQRGVGATLLSLSHFAIGAQPFLALFLFNRQLVTKLLFTKLFRISGPTLNIEKSQGRTGKIKRHRVMQQQSHHPFVLGANGTQPNGCRMGAVVEAGAILRHQDDLLLADALKGRLIMRQKKLFHSDLRVTQKPIRRSRLGPSLTSLGDISLWAIVEVARQSQKPLLQALVVKLCLAKLLLRPIMMLFFTPVLGLCLRLSATESFTRFFAQSIHIHIFAAQRKCFLSILSSPARSFSHINPIGGPIRSPRKTAPIDKALQQHRRKTITLLPVHSNAPLHLPEHMAGQVLNFDPRTNQKPAVGDHLGQIFLARSIAPANPPIACLNAPGRCAQSQSSQPFSSAASDQITQLRSAKRPRAQIMIALHQLVPAPRSRALSAAHSDQLHPAQFSQTTLDRLRGGNRITKLGLLTSRRAVSQRPQPDHSPPIKSRKRYPATHLLELAVEAAPVQFPTNSARQRHPRYPRLALYRRFNVRNSLFRKHLPTNDHIGKIALSLPRVQSKSCVARLAFQRGILLRGLLTLLWKRGRGDFWTEYSGRYAANFWVMILVHAFSNLMTPIFLRIIDVLFLRSSERAFSFFKYQ